MARRGLIVKSQRQPKFRVRAHSRCLRCFRSRAVYSQFALCRLCFRELALRGELPGVRKATW